MDRDELRTARWNAQRCTQDIVEEFERAIAGDSGKAVIYCNSAIAAVAILMERYGIDPAMAAEVYDAAWRCPHRADLDA